MAPSLAHEVGEGRGEGLPQHPQERCRTDDGDAAKGVQSKQVLVGGDDGVGPTGDRGLKNAANSSSPSHVVIRVSADTDTNVRLDSVPAEPDEIAERLCIFGCHREPQTHARSVKGAVEFVQQFVRVYGDEARLLQTADQF